MTKNRDLKRRIRQRMNKTGESYTAARRHVVTRPAPGAADYPSIGARVNEAASHPAAGGPSWARTDAPGTAGSSATASMLEAEPAESRRVLRVSLVDAVRQQDLEGAMVALALEASPTLGLLETWASLDHLTDRLRPGVMSAPAGPARLGALLRLLYGELGFAVPEEYADPALNHLHRILESRRATPAGLAGLLIVLGRRFELELSPVAFPGHFLVRADVRADVDRPVFVDPATGLPVPEEGLIELAMEELEVSREDAESHLEPCEPRWLVVRLLQNLANAHRARGQDGPGLWIADRLFEISGSPSDRVDRGLYLWAMGSFEAAHEDLSAYLAVAPGSPDADPLARAKRRIRVLDGILN